MRIGLDTRPLFFTRAGISRYTRELITYLHRSTAGHDLELFSARSPGSLSPDGIPDSSWRVLRWPLGRRPLEWAWENVALANATRHLDVMHFPRFSVPARRTCPSVVTIHDLAFLVRGNTAPEATRRYFTRCTRRAIERADRVIVVSESTRDDLIDQTGCDSTRVEVVYNGVDERFHAGNRGDSRSVVERHFGLTGPFLLFVGTIEPRKNIEGLIHAHEQLGTHLPLVICGRKGWMYEKVFLAAERSRAREKIRFLDHVPDGILPDLYRAASVFVYPSHYEGFGLPVLEAMACGTPVVSSSTSAIPEIAGDAAILVNPDSPEEIAEGIRRLTDDPTEAERFQALGPARARTFTWERTARDTLEVYRNAAA